MGRFTGRVETQPCAAEANGKTLPNSSGPKSSHNLAKPSGLTMLSMSLRHRFPYPTHLPEPLSQLRDAFHPSLPAQPFCWPPSSFSARPGAASHLNTPKPRTTRRPEQERTLFQVFSIDLICKSRTKITIYF